MAEYFTIGEVAENLGIAPHVLRFWENEFKQLKPSKRRGGRRFYSESDIETIEIIRTLLHVKGYTIKGAKKALSDKNQGFLFNNDDLPAAEQEAKPSPKSKAKKAAKPEVSDKKLEKILKKLKKAEELMKSA